MSDFEPNGLNEKLRVLIETVDVASMLTEPLTRSIQDLLVVSASQMGSAEASVLVRDGDEGDLLFLAAIGKVAEQLVNMKVPAGKGIAGFVLSSGQPMAVSDVGEEESFYADVDKKTGYSTQTILATPLRHNGEVIGVLEYINRTGEPPFAAFTPEQMDRAALFADAIASLVNAYESAKLFHELGEKVLSVDADLDISEVREWLSTLRGSAEHRKTMDLAIMLREIASRGETETELCSQLLESLLTYLDAKAETGFLKY